MEIIYIYIYIYIYIMELYIMEIIYLLPFDPGAASYGFIIFFTLGTVLGVPESIKN